MQRFKRPIIISTCALALWAAGCDDETSATPAEDAERADAARDMGGTDAGGAGGGGGVGMGGAGGMGMGGAGGMGMCPRGGPADDDDGDGLENGIETDGWAISVDALGFGLDILGQLESRDVASDPCVADTDGDGLDDYAEFLIKSDPSRRDTDGDGLGDWEESERWQTSLNSVDSDGDGRGCDPDNPGVPTATLFDGAELALRANPDDPDGWMIPGVGATSPTLADTDGDGICDVDEIPNPTRSAVLAEMPRLDAYVAEGDAIDLRLVQTYAETEEQQFGYESTVTQGEERNWSRSDEISVGWSLSSTVLLGFKEAVEIEGGVSTDVLKAKGSFEAYQEFSVTTGISTNYAVNITEGGARSMSEAYSDSESFSSGKTVTTEGGAIALPLTLENTSDIAYRVEGLEIFVKFFDQARQSYLSLATLLPANAYTLSPGDRVQVELSDDTIDANTMRALLRNPRALSLRPANYSLTNADGTDFKFVTEQTFAQTALVYIDVGSAPTRIYRVATNVDRGLGGSYPGLTMGALLDDAGIEYALINDEDTGLANLVELEGWAVEVHSTEDDGPVLDEAPYPEGIDPGPRVLRRVWGVVVSRQDEPVDVEVDFDKMVFQARDEVRFVYLRDDDRDGIFDSEEFIYGSSDENAHSDGAAGINNGDGLSDFWEIRVGWSIDVALDGNGDNPPPYHVHSNPALADTDNDGWNDNEERIAGTDPTKKDTDGDGLLDPEDAEPLRFVNTPPFISPVRVGEPDSWVETQVVGNTINLRVRVRDDESNFGGIEIGTSVGGEERYTVVNISEDQREEAQRTGVTEIIVPATIGYPRAGVYTMGVRAFDTFGEFSDWAPQNGFVFRLNGDQVNDCWLHYPADPYDPAVGGVLPNVPRNLDAPISNPQCAGLAQNNTTFSMWVNVAAPGAGPGLIWGELDFPAFVLNPDGTVALYHLDVDEIPDVGWPVDPEANVDLTSVRTGALPRNQWVHLVGTLTVSAGGRGTEMRLYKDGVSVAETPAGINTCGEEWDNESCVGFAFGGFNPAQWQCAPVPYVGAWDGQISDVKIWQRALADEEIAALFDAGRRPELRCDAR